MYIYIHTHTHTHIYAYIYISTTLEDIVFGIFDTTLFSLGDRDAEGEFFLSIVLKGMNVSTEAWCLPCLLS